MNPRKNPLDNYKRFLVSRVTSNTSFVEFVEYCLVSEEDAANYCFHKIMVHSWPKTTSELFDALSEHFGLMFIPIETTTNGEIISFYTTSLFLINKIIRFEFMFTHQRALFNVDILFNDKTADELLNNHITLDDVVSGIISRRLSDKFKLDLSNFCADPEFKEKNIDFYKLTLLSHFKLLMIRIGRDTKELDLSNNNLTVPPLEVLNFFIKGDLIAINLSNNNIASINDLVRVTSKVEKLWLEGNPLCDEVPPMLYVKQLTTKFPRLEEVDGVQLNNHTVPIVKNFMPCNANSAAKMVIDKFLTLYYTCYDKSTEGARKRKGIEGFYSDDSMFSISLFDPPSIKFKKGVIDVHSVFKSQLAPPWKRRAAGKRMVTEALSGLPCTKHDPTTFTVDVLEFNNNRAILVVEGIFKDECPDEKTWKLRRFRRTFMFRVSKNTVHTTYSIVNDLLTVIPPLDADDERSFKHPLRHLNPLSLIDPERDEISTLVTVYTHVTQLKRDIAEEILKFHNWNIKDAIQSFIIQYKKQKIDGDKFVYDEDDISDLSFTDDDIVYFDLKAD